MKIYMSVRHELGSGAGIWKNSRMRVHIIATRELVLKIEKAILKTMAENEPKS